MSQFFQLMRPVLRAATGFHANLARLTIAEVFQQRGALYLLVDNFTGMLINEVNLHRFFAISTPTGVYFMSWILQLSGSFMHPVLGTMMPKVCEDPYLTCRTLRRSQIVGMRSSHSPRGRGWGFCL